MAGKSLVLEAGAAVWLLVSQKTGTPPTFANKLYKLGLLYDKIQVPHLDSDFKTVYTGTEPYAKLESLDFLDVARGIAPPTRRNLSDLHEAFDEHDDPDSGHYAYMGTRATLLKALQEDMHFYVLPGQRDGFLGFCLKYQPQYVDLMKQSFLSFDILDLIFDEHISSFNPEPTLGSIKQFGPFKSDFQKGVFGLSQELSGSYRLSDEQKTYIRKKLTVDEQKLLEFMRPENLKKFNLNVLDAAAEITSVALQIPVPTGIVISIAREIRKIREFRNKRLDFVLSLFILKKVGVAQTSLELPSCKICSLSVSEIKNLSEKQCDEIVHTGSFCKKHTIAYLDIRKRYALFGKRLLLTMKEFGEIF